MAIFEAASAAKELIAVQWPFILTAVVASAAVWLFQLLLKENPISKIPLIGDDMGDEGKRRNAFMMGAKDVYSAGYRKFKTGLFRVTSPRESTVVVVSPHFLKELSNLPDDQVSFDGAVRDFMHSRYTGVRADDTTLPTIIKKELTPALGRLNASIAEEVDLAFQDELPPCKDFTRITLTPHLLRIVAKVSGRIFAGTEISRSDEYMDMSINYTLELMNAVSAITALKADVRHTKAAHLPEVIQLQQRKKRTLEFIRPLIAARKKAMAEDADWERPDDFVQWILNGEEKYNKTTVEEVAEIQLGLTFAAIHTTTMTTTNAFYTLAALPSEIVAEIRDEIRAVLKEYGTFSTPALQKMKKLDSFLREVLRLHPVSWTTFQRKVTRTIMLSNGQIIPAGVIIELPSYSMVMDPERFDNPHEFDAFRHYRAREAEGLEGSEKVGAGAANQMVSISTSNLQFGYGRHACPGRFFAANEIKMIVGRAILDYEIKNADGITQRYPNIEYNESNIPDPSKELMFKRVAI